MKEKNGATQDIIWVFCSVAPVVMFFFNGTILEMAVSRHAGCALLLFSPVATVFLL